MAKPERRVNKKDPRKTLKGRRKGSRRKKSVSGYFPPELNRRKDSDRRKNAEERREKEEERRKNFEASIFNKDKIIQLKNKNK